MHAGGDLDALAGYPAVAISEQCRDRAGDVHGGPVAAERDTQRLRQQLEEREEELDSLRREMVRLRKEREEIRGRVEKMLGQIESISEEQAVS